jgi:hypothetical protein
VNAEQTSSLQMVLDHSNDQGHADEKMNAAVMMRVSRLLVVKAK